MTLNGTKLVEKRSWILGDKFDARMPHHEGIQALWETKWKFPCTKSVYPFHDGKFEDFEPIFERLIKVRLQLFLREATDWSKNNITDGYGDAYTESFFPVAEALTLRGDDLVSKGSKAASDLYLRAACVYRISRFPYITSFPKVNSAVKWKAWEAQKKVYMKAAGSWEQPIKEIMVPFNEKTEIEREDIPVYVRLPKTAKEGKAPVVLLFTGLDGYRPDNTQRTDEFNTRGWACVVAEIPGTADCPADPADAKSPDRLWTSLLAWMERDGSFDMKKVMVWGLSTGGYYAVRIAHTHSQQLRGVVAQGAGTHHFFGREWLEKADGHEYPFPIAPAMTLKHGYNTFEELMDGAQKKFSLLENEILEKPSARLLLINGTHDGLMPIEDSMLLFEHGSAKEERFFSNALHMGYPMANSAVYPWMESVMA
ncbi:Heptaketide hydrolyase ayg1 [Lachnellula suecica]|uniref:Heptaketide hydrolyase ayg1 n=1 Tax=Lachnellula suecica TaxID=602035 RepID=A0A8T9CH35_9HELO|nr:Heptaketide hydrolyase ayg1 [Lachnellula suecica]